VAALSIIGAGSVGICLPLADADCAAARADSERLHQLWQSRKAFCEARDAVFADLARADITLKEACRRIRAASSSLYPVYLQLLDQFCPEQGTEERLARNVVGLFAISGPGLEDAKALARVRHELVQWLGSEGE
jgi:hypothetical protein